MERALELVLLFAFLAVVGVAFYKKVLPKVMADLKESFTLYFSQSEAQKEADRERLAALKAKLKAEQAYKDALDVLKSTKTADARINALEAGRAYVRLCREDGREAIFDEMMLQNDLSAYGAKD